MQTLLMENFFITATAEVWNATPYCTDATGVTLLWK